LSGIEPSLTETATAVDGFLHTAMPEPDGPEAVLFEAMRYASIGGGKRLRPLLVIASGALFHVGRQSLLRVAAAVELVHCYSLVHDDLPAMDDDAMRRGKPTCHIAFDEATAILAGDALQALAFETLASPETHAEPAICCELVRCLALAAGGHGMVGGQAIDMEAVHETLDIGEITRLQRLKTGALIAFACEAGAILGKAPRAARQALRAYAHDLGLAFQITDDILDAEGDPSDMGKAARKDAAAGKATFISVLGLERARGQADMLAEQAVAHLKMFEGKAELLRDVARFVVARRD